MGLPVPTSSAAPLQARLHLRDRRGQVIVGQRRVDLGVDRRVALVDWLKQRARFAVVIGGREHWGDGFNRDVLAARRRAAAHWLLFASGNVPRVHGRENHLII